MIIEGMHELTLNGFSSLLESKILSLCMHSKADPFSMLMGLSGVP